MSDSINIAILIDALGWEIARHFEFCRDMLPVSRPLETVLGYSTAAIPSILTGSSPSEHGIWSMYRYEPRRSPFRFLRYIPAIPAPVQSRIRGLTRKVADRRKVIKGYYDLYDVPLKFLGYFDIPQRSDPFQPGGASVETLFDRMKAEKIRFKYWGYRTAEAENFEELLASLHEEIDFLFLYTAELDALMHRAGTGHESVREKLQYYEHLLEKILERAALVGREVLVHVFGDHGMTDVFRTVDVWGAADKAGLKIGKNCMAFYDSTMARFWIKDDSRERIVEFLGGVGGGKILSDSDLKEFGCFFQDRSYGEIIFLADPGVMIVPSFMGREKLAAMHGYHPDDKYSRSCFLTNYRSKAPPVSILGIKDFLLENILGEN